MLSACASNLLASASNLGLWPPTSSDGLQFNFTCPVSSGVFSLRLACGTAFTSVRISLSVSLLVRAQGEPEGPQRSKVAALAQSVRGRSDQSLFKVHWNLYHSQVHTAFTCKRGEVLLGVSNEVRLHRFSSPPFGSPFHPFPFYTPWFPLFFHVLLSSCLVISSLSSFARTLVPALSVYVHFYIHFQHRFWVAQVFTMRWGSSVVPVHLVSLSLQPHTFLSRLVFLLMSSSFCLCRAHLHNRPGLNSFGLPSWRRVCVCPL